MALESKRPLREGPDARIGPLKSLSRGGRLYCVRLRECSGIHLRFLGNHVSRDSLEAPDSPWVQDRGGRSAAFCRSFADCIQEQGAGYDLRKDDRLGRPAGGKEDIERDTGPPEL